MSKFILTQPETGWQRIDDSHSKIIYTGTFTRDVNSSSYNGSAVSTTSTNNQIEFYFFGTKLRIISDYRNAHRSNYINVTIDGKTETFSQLGGNELLHQVVTYEKTGLAAQKHHVIIHANQLDSGTAFTFDAIDIDASGVMLLQNESMESQMIKTRVKETILNNELFQKYCAFYEEINE